MIADFRSVVESVSCLYACAKKYCQELLVEMVITAWSETTVGGIDIGDYNESAKAYH